MSQYKISEYTASTPHYTIPLCQDVTHVIYPQDKYLCTYVIKGFITTYFQEVMYAGILTHLMMSSFSENSPIYPGTFVCIGGDGVA